MIDKTIKNIKKILQDFKKNTYSKNIRKKNTSQGFGGDIYSKNSSLKKIFFVFPIYKRAKYKK